MATKVKYHGNTRYHWRRFADGKKHRIRAGRGDRTANVESLRRQICDAARTMGMVAETRVAGDSVWFIFTKLEGS